VLQSIITLKARSRKFIPDIKQQIQKASQPYSKMAIDDPAMMQSSQLNDWFFSLEL
jgi:hypothetical protein